jgi:uncharacterized protein YjbI with pentapeptide repeats
MTREIQLEKYLNKLKNLPFISDDNPLEDWYFDKEGEKNFFRFGQYCEVLGKIILNPKNKTPLTILVDGKWGAGKTSLLKMMKKWIDDMSTEIRRQAQDESSKDKNKLLLRPAKTVWFNAWQYSSEPSMLAALLKTIFAEMGKNSSMQDKVSVQVDGKELFKQFIDKLSGGIVGHSSSWINEFRIEEQLPFFDQFSGIFQKFVQTYAMGNDPKRSDQNGIFVIFVDDLDRCPPDKLPRLFEAIKLFLGFEGCIFVLGMDNARIARMIQKAYEMANISDAHAYIQKIIQVHFKIPPLRNDDMKEFIRYLIGENVTPEIENIFSVAANSNPRSVKRLVNDYRLLQDMIISIEGDDVFKGKHSVVAKWIAVGFRSPSVAKDKENFLRLQDSVNQKIQNGQDSDMDKNLIKILQHKPQLTETELDILIHVCDVMNLNSVIVNQVKGTRQSVMEAFKNGESLKNMDLSGMDLSNTELSFANMKEMNLKKINLQNANLQRVNLEQANLQGAKLGGANFKGANLSQANLAGANLENANLENTNLENANLENTNLSQATLTSAELKNSLLHGSLLKGCDLTKASLRNAKLGKYSAQDSIGLMREINAAQLSGAILVETDMADVNLSDIPLLNVNFTRVKNLNFESLAHRQDFANAYYSDEQYAILTELIEGRNPRANK